MDGSFTLKATLGKWILSSQLAFAYNEGSRDLFWPSTLLEGNNYTSTYYGANRRLLLQNKVKYETSFGTVHHISIEGGQTLQSDKHSYNYAYAYKGLSDFIKINAVDGNKSHADYLEPKSFTAYRFLDRLKSHLLSFFGHVNYTYKQLLSFNAVVRSDASSFAQPTARWFVSPALSLNWNLKNNFLSDNATINHLDVKASWGRVGRLFPNANLGAGPHYSVDLGWNSAPRIASYNGMAPLTRPYSNGWVGYDIQWPYSETKSFNVSTSLFNNRLSADVTLYRKDDKRMMLGMPTLASSGYAKTFKQGLWVRNTGVEFGLEGILIQNESKQMVWTFGGNISLNKNTLEALPDGLNEVVIENRKLVVGKPIDQFWLLQDEGLYASDADVLINPATNKPMTYNGLSLKRGDARWKDTNGDYVIDNKDKMLEGHVFPKLFGGFNTSFQWGAFSLTADFYYALGQNILDKAVAQRLDFVNVSAAQDIQTTLLKDVTFWKKTFDHANYPRYNPWSDVKPYQLDQDLYLRKASYLKLRTLSLGYDLSKTNFFSEAAPNFTKMLIYVAANNVFTVTPYPGVDPEIANYIGQNTGYGMPFMRSFTVGLKVDF